MNKTAIEWAQNPDGTPGYTLNVKTGCLNGCPYCYARELANGRLKPRYFGGDCIPIPYTTNKDLDNPFYPRFWPGHLKQPSEIKKPSGIFLDDMSDWMGDYWPREWTEYELQMMRDNPQHRFYTLTKQPQNLVQWSPFPDNCWVGVTATDREQYVKALQALSPIEATLKFLSLEPLLGDVMAGEWRTYTVTFPYIVGGANEERVLRLTTPPAFGYAPGWVNEDMVLRVTGIKCLIIGAMTGRKAKIEELARQYPKLTPMPWGKIWTLQPPLSWVNEIVSAADQAGIQVFLKNNLKLSQVLALRQEMPGE